MPTSPSDLSQLDWPGGIRLGLHGGRSVERQRRLRLSLPKEAEVWDYAPLVDVVGWEPGFDTPRFSGFSHELIHPHEGRPIRINPTDPQVPTGLDVGLRVGALAGLMAIDDALARNDAVRFDPA